MRKERERDLLALSFAVAASNVFEARANFQWFELSSRISVCFSSFSYENLFIQFFPSLPTQRLLNVIRVILLFNESNARLHKSVIYTFLPVV